MRGRFFRTVSRLIIAFVLVCGLQSYSSLQAQTTQTITLISGGPNTTPDGRDPLNQFTLDGTTFSDAYVVAPAESYGVIPGTRYISSSPDSIGLEGGSITYRAQFHLPEGAAAPSLSIDIHADNKATLRLNGVEIGSQPWDGMTDNFQDPAETYKVSDPTFFRDGTNVIEFEIHNFDNPTAFDYKATVSFGGRGVAIDIKPGDAINSINLSSNGSVPVAILSSADFDARNVNPYSVSMAGASVNLKGKAQTPMASFGDVNGDGRPDLVVHITTQALNLAEGEAEAFLTGYTYGGVPFFGRDSVRIVPLR